MSVWLLELSQKMLISARVNAAVFSSVIWIRRYLNICWNTALRKVCPFWSREKTASHRLPRWLDFPILPILERYFIRWWDAHRAIIESLSFQRHRKYSQTIWQKFPKDIIIFCRYREHRFVLREKTGKIFSKLQKQIITLKYYLLHYQRLRWSIIHKKQFWVLKIMVNFIKTYSFSIFWLCLREEQGKYFVSKYSQMTFISLFCYVFHVFFLYLLLPIIYIMLTN